MILKNRYSIRYLFVLTALIIFSEMYAYAAINMGNLQVTPSLQVMESYDDNIYLASNNAIGSTYISVKPGLDLYLPVRTHEFRLNYNADILGYKENPSVNNAINNYAFLQAKLVFPSGLLANFTNNYMNTTDPANSELEQRTQRIQNDFQGNIGYRFSQYITATIGYTRDFNDYIPENLKPLFNRRESETSFEAAYTYSPKTSLLLVYSLGNVDYSYSSNLNSSKYTQIRAGLRGELTKLTIGEIKLGMKDKKYNDISGRDHTTPVMALNTLTNFSKRSSLSLGLNRDFVESVFADNLYYISTGAHVKFNQKIMRNWNAALSCLYELNDYPQEMTIGTETKLRQDNYVNMGFDIQYIAHEMITLSAGYALRNRWSNFGAFSYNDNVFDVSAKVAFGGRE